MTDVTRGTREYLMIMRKNDGCEKEILRAITRDARKDHGQKMEREKSCGDEKQPAKDVSAETASMDSKNRGNSKQKNHRRAEERAVFLSPEPLPLLFLSFFLPSFTLVLPLSSHLIERRPTIPGVDLVVHGFDVHHTPINLLATGHPGVSSPLFGSSRKYETHT